MNALPPHAGRCRVGIDVGGTFTDLVMIDQASGKLTFFKEPSVPNDPSVAVERGIAGIIARAGVDAGVVELVIHGTTIGLNTIIQRRGAKLALVVSRGNRDVFEIGRGRLTSPFDMRTVKEIPLVPRDHVFEIDARVLPSGTVDARPAQSELDELVARLKAEDFDAVAVMLINSYLHPEQERDISAMLRKALPGVLVTESSAIWPEIREYERALIASLNAYIHPLMESYLARLSDRLNGIGIGAPIYLTTNNGGTLGIGTATSRPIDTILSGPASGVVASVRLASLSNVTKIITFDMGGTSSDMAVSSHGLPEYTTSTTVGDLPLMLPVVNVSAIGAGGGSIVSVDAHGILKIGPRSAGADPGPICYGRGGTEPTVTDCFLSLGLLRPDGFLGGAMALDSEGARSGLAPVAERIGRTGGDAVQETAEAALSVATAKMSTEIYKAFAKSGLDPREYTLVAYGGAGPTIANLLAEEAKLDTILIPPSPGTLCAFGALVTDLKRDFVRTLRRRMDGSEEFAATLKGTASEMMAEAQSWLREEGSIVGPTEVLWTAELRYVGESQEIGIAVSGDDIEAASVRNMAAAFHDAHQRAYGFHDENGRLEILNLRSQVVGQVPAIDIPRIAPAEAPVKPVSKRRVYMRGQWADVDVYARADLRDGDAIEGPALVEQEDTTIVLHPGWRATVNVYGIIYISRI